MKLPEIFPAFDDCFSDLNQFILKLVEAYEAGTIRSWDDLEEKVHVFFTPERMEEMESLVPGWQKMASYSEGITLVHVMCVFLGLFMLPEFQSLTPHQKQLAKWIVLFHDIAKIHIQGKKTPCTPSVPVLRRQKLSRVLASRRDNTFTNGLITGANIPNRRLPFTMRIPRPSPTIKNFLPFSSGSTTCLGRTQRQLSLQKRFFCTSRFILIPFILHLPP